MKKYIPLALIVVAMALAYYFGLHDYFTLDALKQHRSEIKRFVSHHPMATPILFIVIYITSTALSLPLDAFFCITAGFLFSQPLCTLYLLIGGVTGGAILFLAAKTAFADLLRKKAGPRIHKLETEFKNNATAYLLFLRLIPVLPTWIINVAPAIFNTPFKTFLWTSSLGIIPGAYVFSMAGKGLGKILDAWGRPDYRLLFTPEFLIGIAVMLILAALIFLFRKKFSHR